MRHAQRLDLPEELQRPKFSTEFCDWVWARYKEYQDGSSFIKPLLKSAATEAEEQKAAEEMLTSSPRRKVDPEPLEQLIVLSEEVLGSKLDKVRVKFPQVRVVTRSLWNTIGLDLEFAGPKPDGQVRVVLVRGTKGIKGAEPPAYVREDMDLPGVQITEVVSMTQMEQILKKATTAPYHWD